MDSEADDGAATDSGRDGFISGNVEVDVNGDGDGYVDQYVDPYNSHDHPSYRSDQEQNRKRREWMKSEHAEICGQMRASATVTFILSSPIPLIAIRNPLARNNHSFVNYDHS